VATPPAKVSLFFSVHDCEGNPVPDLVEEDFRISEDGNQVSLFESQAEIRPRSLFFRSNILLLLDVSGSMQQGDAMSSLKRAGASFVQSLLATPEARADYRIGLWAFDGRERITRVVGFTNDTSVLSTGIDTIDRYGVDASTNLHGALLDAFPLLNSVERENQNIDIQFGVIVVFTDGTDQAGRVSQESALSTVRSAVDMRGGERFVFTVGLGGEIDEDFLREAGVHGFEWASDVDQVTSAFGRIAERIEAQTQGYYLLEYCTPKRAGTHQLQLDLEVNGQRDTIGHEEFSAQGFGANCRVGDDPEIPPITQTTTCSVSPFSRDGRRVPGLWFLLVVSVVASFKLRRMGAR